MKHLNKNNIKVNSLNKWIEKNIIYDDNFDPDDSSKFDDFKTLLSKGVNLNSRNKNFIPGPAESNIETPLIRLIQLDNGSTKLNKYILELISAGANLNKQDGDGNTACIHAVSLNNSIYKELIKAGANLNIKNESDETALLIASYYNNINIVIDLILAGADLKIKDQNDLCFFDYLDQNNKNIIIRKYPKYYSIIQDIVASETNENTIIIKNPDGSGFLVAKDIISRDRWYVADKVCAEYRGYGFSNWYLPNIDQLQKIYKYYKKNKIKFMNWCWSSTEALCTPEQEKEIESRPKEIGNIHDCGPNSAWLFNFSVGEKNIYPKHDIVDILPVLDLNKDQVEVFLSAEKYNL